MSDDEMHELAVLTRSPEQYLLLNTKDGTAWVGTEKGWVAAPDPILDCHCGRSHAFMPTDTMEDGTEYELICRKHKRHEPCRQCRYDEAMGRPTGEAIGPGQGGL